MQAIFDEVDLDGNGEIEFSEWIVASIDKRSLVTEEKLRLAFLLFDKDRNNTIQIEEVRETLTSKEGQVFSDEEERLWRNLIEEYDTDGNGEIDFEEFSKMIRKIIINEEQI